MSSGAAFFISYSRGDASSRKLAAALSYNLPRLGYEVFVDVVGLQAGEKWTEQLERQIDVCDVFVILLSEKSLTSEHVSRELERALARNGETGRPLIVPIRTQFTRELEGDERVLDEFERLEWQSKSDTPHVVERIDESVSHVLPKRVLSPPPPPRRRWRAQLRWIAGATLLLALLMALSFVQVRALRGAKTDENARVAFDRLRTQQMLLLPRLWLIGPWNPERLAEAHFTRSADAIDAAAAPMLASRMREEADRGLLLATLAAFKRGGSLSDAARDYAQQQSYRLLDRTLSGEQPSPGTALAVWHGAQHIVIAEGTRVWSCADGCTKTELPNLDAAVDAAFVSETRLLTVSVDSSVNEWDLATFANPIGSMIRESTGVAVAADGGDAAIAFETPPYVIGLLADGRRVLVPHDLPRAARATFGPCRRCVTLVLEDERAVGWNYITGLPWLLTDGAADAAATRNGVTAVAMRDGTIRFYDANSDPIGRPVPLRFESLRQLTISPDGTRAAVVHDDVLSVVDVAGKILQLIPAGRTPAPIAAAWAGDVLVTRTPSEVRLWNLTRSVRDVAPENAWRELRKQLGVTIDAGGNELGWNRARRRIESQD